jgi:hypothetical protein
LICRLANEMEFAFKLDQTRLGQGMAHRKPEIRAPAIVEFFGGRSTR